METEKFFDLKILNIEEKNNFEEIKKISKETDADVINIFTQNLRFIEESKKIGFFYRPLKIGYTLKTPESKEQYLNSLGKNNKRQFVKDLKRFKEEKLEIEKKDKISKEIFLEWLEVYNANIKAKEKGISRVNYTWYERHKKDLCGIFVRKDQKMIAGVILTKKKDSLSISFLFSRPEFNNIGINRALILEIISLAKESSYDKIEMGIDTNLYGHHLSTGLFLFKKSIGFRVDDKPKFGKVLTKINNFKKFNDEIFFISHNKGLIGNLFFKNELKKERIKNFEADFLEGLNVFLIKENNINRVS